MGTEAGEEGQIPLERKSLQQLAADTAGNYLDLTVDDRDMRRVDRQVDSYYVVVEDSALPWLDSGYPLIYICLALFLLWFRKGWTLTWAWLLVPLLLLGNPTPARAEGRPAASNTTLEAAGYWFADLWLSGDQQGRLLMQMGRYQQAAGRFTNPVWRGMAHYYAEDFMVAAEYFSRQDSDAALFNEANARAHARDYIRAVNRYDRLLQRSPQYPGAKQNRQKVQDLIDEINRLSESQQQEAGISGGDKELEGDDAIPAEGAREISWEQGEITQLSAEDILQDPATAAMWLRGVQQDPSDFLAVKFSMQLHGRASTPEPEASDRLRTWCPDKK
ncbi:MAG: hypothetical protein DRR04_06125 [Gammaproteobacteria bacterium]|nr:MAG: hypothetical protein DRQ97_05185 [Gammaproteobacteria bacterium]RLA60283.1 MAG: hypothetical protein DRR04_06125 [Gammaproteobacteria bacterium]